MKPVKWETSPGAMVALLATRSFATADLYSFTLVGGGVLRYTTADTDMGYGGLAWTHGGPLFDQKDNKVVGHWKLGLDTDTWQCVIAPRPADPLTGAPFPDRIGDVPWLAAARGGALDGATVQVDRAYLAAWPPMPRPAVVAPIGVINIFTGRVATIDIGRAQAVIGLNSHLELLDQQMPINLYQAPCRFKLFDLACGLNPAAFVVAGSAAAGSTQSAILVASLSPPAGSGTFGLGRVVMTSGLNNGFARSVRWWGPSVGAADGALKLISPFPFAIAPGDTFNAYPGCDRQLGTCEAFGNRANFGGQPFIPPPETSV